MSTFVLIYFTGALLSCAITMPYFKRYRARILQDTKEMIRTGHGSVNKKSTDSEATLAELISVIILSWIGFIVTLSINFDTWLEERKKRQLDLQSILMKDQKLAEEVLAAGESHPYRELALRVTSRGTMTVSARTVEIDGKLYELKLKV